MGKKRAKSQKPVNDKPNILQEEVTLTSEQSPASLEEISALPQERTSAQEEAFPITEEVPMELSNLANIQDSNARMDAIKFLSTSQDFKEKMLLPAVNAWYGSNLKLQDLDYILSSTELTKGSNKVSDDKLFKSVIKKLEKLQKNIAELKNIDSWREVEVSGQNPHKNATVKELQEARGKFVKSLKTDIKAVEFAVKAWAQGFDIKKDALESALKEFVAGMDNDIRLFGTKLALKFDSELELRVMSEDAAKLSSLKSFDPENITDAKLVELQQARGEFVYNHRHNLDLVNRELSKWADDANIEVTLEQIKAWHASTLGYIINSALNVDDLPKYMGETVSISLFHDYSVVEAERDNLRDINSGELNQARAKLVVKYQSDLKALSILMSDWFSDKDLKNLSGKVISWVEKANADAGMFGTAQYDIKDLVGSLEEMKVAGAIDEGAPEV